MDELDFSENGPAYEVLREVTPFVSVVLERNPSSLTLEGTNSWILKSPEVAASVVVDPGHDDQDHLAVLSAVGTVSLVLLTHHHPDHADGAQRFGQLVGAPVRAFDPELCFGGESLMDGETISSGGLEIQVLHTPGHTEDSVSFLIEKDNSTTVLTGDTILGRGTTGVGDLAAYLDSLQKLVQVPSNTWGLPGHGPELPDLRSTVEYYLEHREIRLNQVREAIRVIGPQATEDQIVEMVYRDVAPALIPAAAANVRVQLEYLRQRGEHP